MAAASPLISVQLSLSPTTYNFRNPIPPTLELSLVSHAERPLTIFTWATALDPQRGMVSGAFSITDLATDTLVPQTKIMINRTPFSRARGSGDEGLFLTLYPNTPAVVSTGFGRGGGKFPPEPKHIVQRGWVRDEHGKELRIRRPTSGCGVDGLESGHRYRVDVVEKGLRGRWWWGTKEELMVEPGGTDWNLVPGEKSALSFGTVEGVEFSIDSLTELGNEEAS